MKKMAMLTAMMTVVSVMLVSSTVFAEGIEKRNGFIVRIGHLDEILQGSGYVNISVEKDIDKDGVSQLRFSAEDTWQNELETGDEVFYLVHQGRIIKVFPTPVSNTVFVKGGAVEKHEGYVVRIGNLDMIRQGSGYVNISVEKDIDEEGVSQLSFKEGDVWQENLKAGDEVFYLVHKKRIIKVFPKKE